MRAHFMVLKIEGKAPVALPSAGEIGTEEG